MNTKEDFIIVEMEIFSLYKSNLLDNDAVANHPAIQSLYQEAVIAEKTKKQNGTRFTRF